MIPPPLPHDELARVLRVASIDGRLVLVIAGVSAILAAAARVAPATVAGIIAAGAGAMELHGVGLLARGEPRGLRWIVRSQLGLLLAIWGYVAWRLIDFNPHLPPLVMEQLEAEFDRAGLPRSQITPMLMMANWLTCVVLAVVSLAYQGGLAWFFHRRDKAVRQALGEQA